MKKDAKELARAKQTLASAARRRRATEEMVLAKAALAATAVGLGVLNRMNVPIAVMGVPWKLPAALIMGIVQTTTRGRTSVIAGAASDAMMATYLERAVTTGDVVSGAMGELDYLSGHRGQYVGGGEV